jgi:uncharacterized protein (TIGR03086 family)
VVAIEELVVHGWDVARATGQDVAPTAESLGHVESFLDVFAEALASGQGPYGPPVDVADGADRLDRYLAAAGRDPGWQPGRPPLRR